MRRSIVPKAFAIAIALLALPGCLGLAKSPGSGEAVRGEATVAAGQFFGSGKVAYEKTVYKLARTHCLSCHTSSFAPHFAGPNLSDSYDAMISSGKVGFPDFANGRLLSNTGPLTNKHCGSYCDGSNFRDWELAVKAWWDGGECLTTKSCGATGPGGPGGGGGGTPTGGKFVTAEVLIPANIPVIASGGNANTTVQMRFPLGSLVPTIPDAVFTLQVNHIGPLGTGHYQFSRPTITLGTTTKSLTVYDVTMVLNKVVDPNATTYRVIDAIVAPSGGQSLSASALILTPKSGPAKDLLAISFLELSEATGLCKNVANYTANTPSAKSVLTTSCTSCHANQGLFRINTADTDTVQCKNSLARSNPSDPTSSPLLLLPQGGLNQRTGATHPTVGAVTGSSTAAVAARTALIRWIESEK